MSDLPPWRELARRTTACRPDVERLVRALREVPPPEVQTALETAAREGAWEEAQGLLLATVAAGQASDPEPLLRVMPHLDAGWEVVAALVGKVPGDATRKVELLLEGVATRRLGIDWEIEALRLAVALLEGDARAAPPELRRALRVTSRSGEISEELAPLLAEAVLVTGDADARALTRAWEDGEDQQQSWLAATREEAARPLLEALPAEPPPKVTAGFTLRRSVEKVGRNDPCPCGSGKKFKKCCEAKAAAREEDPSPVEGATLAEVLAEPGRWLSLEQLELLSLKELLRLDVGRATPEQQTRVIELLARSGYWERVEPLLEQVAGPDPDEHQDLLGTVVNEAEAQGASQPLVRLIDRWGQFALDPGCARVSRALHARDPQALQILEEVAREALGASDPVQQIELAFALLGGSSALGILATRGVLRPDRYHDGQMLMDEVERARDRLLLPPDDPFWPSWDVLTGRVPAPAPVEEDQPEVEEQDLHALRERLRVTAARASELEQALERERRERRTQERRGSPAERVSAEPEELRRLRTKVEELKALLAQGGEERRALREELRELQAAREDAGPDRGPEGRAPDGREDEPEEEGEPFPAGERAPLVPVFADAAARALRALDPPTARLALRVVHRLAAGDPGAWSGAKRLQKVRDLASARVGIHHRLLFRPRPEQSELELVDLIHRRELEATLRRR